ncbi:hypothetical protein V5F69_15090 [Xanthobacter sp. V2C-4]|uniref:hypothetical protein n=1 Tax=Xanthobacter albus TaxID=3119929 RepID=UPI003726BF95
MTSQNPPSAASQAGNTAFTHLSEEELVAEFAQRHKAVAEVAERHRQYLAASADPEVAVTTPAAQANIALIKQLKAETEAIRTELNGRRPSGTPN